MKISVSALVHQYLAGQTRKVAYLLTFYQIMIRSKFVEFHGFVAQILFKGAKRL